MPEKIGKKFYYSTTCTRDNFSNIRQLSSSSLTEVIDKIMRIYKQSYGHWPDSIEISRKSTYTY